MVKPRVRKSTKAGIIFPVAKVENSLRKGNYAKRISTKGAVYLAGVLEYLIADLIDAAVEKTKRSKKKRITARHILLAIRSDSELDKLLCHVLIPGGGVLSIGQYNTLAEEVTPGEDGTRGEDSTRVQDDTRVEDDTSVEDDIGGEDVTSGAEGTLGEEATRKEDDTREEDETSEEDDIHEEVGAKNNPIHYSNTEDRNDKISDEILAILFD